MAICPWCDQEMMTADSCKEEAVLFPDGTKLPQVPYEPPDSYPDARCPDCNVKPGGFHHPSCDRERCPKCGGQLISCGCLDEE